MRKLNIVNSSTAIFTVLTKTTSGDERNKTWNYQSIIGMMMFLASSTRPDILFAVHQCAKFNSCPKRVHEEAVKRIGRYLKGTADRGTILTPNDTHKLDFLLMPISQEASITRYLTICHLFYREQDIPLHTLGVHYYVLAKCTQKLHCQLLRLNTLHSVKVYAT